MRYFFCVLLFVELIGCQSLRSGEVPRILTLKTAQEFQPGKSSKSDITRRLGEPDRIINISEFSAGETGVVWAYFIDETQSEARLSFSFPENSDIVDSVSWDVRDGDSEQNLERALAHFQGMTFKKYRPKTWENPHSAPDEIFYEHAATGLSIAYLQTPKRVSSISWQSLGRITATETNTSKKPNYPYCIEDICSRHP